MLRLGLDVGTNSIGWCLTDTAAERIVDAGSRIFSNGRAAKTGAPLAATKRAARALRRNRDRKLSRQALLVRRLVDAGLLPPARDPALTARDPYDLRARAVEEALPSHDLGRALMHLANRRGFKSNRKADRGDNDAGKVAEGIRDLRAVMGSRTYGQYLRDLRADMPEKAPRHSENDDGTRDDHRRRPAVRVRAVERITPEGKTQTAYDRYPDRAMLEAEFDAIRKMQEKHHEVDSSAWDAIREAIFFQRALHKPKVGRCRYLPEPRLPRAHPLAQRRALLERVNSLRIAQPGHAERRLAMEERDTVLTLLDNRPPVASPKSAELSFDKVAKALSLRDGARFTADRGKGGLQGDPIRLVLMHKTRLGPRWSTLDEVAQIDLVRRLREEADHAVLVAWLMETHNLDESAAENTADASLPEGFSRLGETATRRLIETLTHERTTEGEPLLYSEAVEASGLGDHSSQATGEVFGGKAPFGPLPYYGRVMEDAVIPGTAEGARETLDELYDKVDEVRKGGGEPSMTLQREIQRCEIEVFGRITNPTVHIGLGQLRRLVNRLITRYGRPDEIVVELSRDLKNGEAARKEIEQGIARARREAERRSDKLEDLGQRDTGRNRILLRLWEELNPGDVKNRCCPYSGKPISPTMIFDGRCDVDHILPLSRTLDDTPPNRTLCLRVANREKGNRTPYEAFGHDPDRWATVQAAIAHMPKAKQTRFAPDAMARFEKQGGMQARQMVDTQYLSRLTRRYLDALYPEDDGKRHVYVVPGGRMTELLRRRWKLDSLLWSEDHAQRKTKNRDDHRHHAVDAALLSVFEERTVQALARASRDAEESGTTDEDGFADVLRAVEPPWDTFRDDLAARIATMVVSHRPDHGRIESGNAQVTAAALHNATAYGDTGERKGDIPLVVTRIAATAIKPSHLRLPDEKGKGARLRDPALVRFLRAAVAKTESNAFDAAVHAAFARPGPYHGTRRVRVVEPIDLKWIADKAGRRYKGYKGDGNHRYELWRRPDGTIVPQVVDMFDAHQPGPDPRPHPAACKILTLRGGDTVALEEDGEAIFAIVTGLTEARVVMVPHREANARDRYNGKTGPKQDVYLRRSANSLINSRVRRVHIDEIGHLRDPGFSPP